MGNKFGLIDLNEKELKEINGGLRMLIISLFMTSVEKALDLIQGLKDGYESATRTQ
jgi:bacteriocin-like protein